MASGGRDDPQRASGVRVARRKRRSEQRRERLAAWVRSIRMLDLAVCAGTIVFSVWAWIVFATADPQDLQWAQAIITLAAAFGAFVLLARFQFRRRWPNPADPTGGERLPLVLVPVVVVPILLLIVTPSGTPAVGYDRGLSIHGVIALMPLLMLVGLLGALVVAIVLLWPILLLIDGIRGTRRVAAGSSVQAQAGISGAGRMVTNAQLIILAIILLAAVGFSVAMSGVYPDASGSSRQRIAQTFRAWVTFQGEPIPSLVAVLLFTVAIVAGVLSNRPEWTKTSLGTSKNPQGHEQK